MKLHFSRLASKFVLDVSKHGWIRPIQAFSLSQFSRCLFHPFQVQAFRQEIFSIGRQQPTKGHLWPPSIKTPHLPLKTVTTGIQTLTVFNCRSWCQNPIWFSKTKYPSFKMPSYGSTGPGPAWLNNHTEILFGASDKIPKCGINPNSHKTSEVQNMTFPKTTVWSSGTVKKETPITQ